MEARLRRNIWLMYGIRVLRTFALFAPILVPFYQSNGLTQTQIYITQSAFALTIVLLEIPSGYFADRFGRKTSVLAGVTLSALGFALYSISYGFTSLLLAELLLGVGYSFISGADSALVYDSFLAMNREDEYLRFESKSHAYIAFSESSASLLGGLLAIISVRTPIVAYAAVYILTIPLALLLMEPARKKSALSRHPFKDVLRITTYALHGHKEIKWLILYGATMATLTHTSVWLIQPYYQASGVPIGWFGVLWAVQMLMMGWFSHNADRYERWLGRTQALLSFPVIGFLTYVLLGSTQVLWMLPALLGFFFVRGVHMPILQHYVNAIVESDIRATVLSVKNLAQKLLYAGLGPLVGTVMDLYSLQTALLFSAGLYGLLSAVVLLQMWRLKVLG